MLLVDSNHPRGRWLEDVMHPAVPLKEGEEREFLVKTPADYYGRDVGQLWPLEAHNR